MEIIGLKIENIKNEELYFSKIVTYPDNPYFKTDDMAFVKTSVEWKEIKDGDFILVKNEEGMMEQFDDFMFKVSFNQDAVILIPLSSFVPFKEREILFDDLDSIKLKGKVLGIARSLSDDFISDTIIRTSPTQKK